MQALGDKSMGKLSGWTRIRILERDRYTCVYCGRRPPEVMLEVDHVVPRVLGGLSDGTNLVTACRECNNGKRAGLISLPDTVVLVPLLSKRAERIRYVHQIETEWQARTGGHNPLPGHGVLLEGTDRPCGRCNRVPDDQRLYFVWHNNGVGGGYWCAACAGTYPA